MCSGGVMAIPDLRIRAASARELMDEPGADRAMLEKTYRRFALVNGALSGWRRAYRRSILPRAEIAQADGRALRIIDVGSGGGDISRALARWARLDGVPVQVVAVDADPRATAWARAQRGPSTVTYRTGLSGDIAGAGERFDVVVSNHLLHHLTTTELDGVLSDSQRLLDRGGLVLHSDIARSRRAYALFASATWPLQSTLLANSFIRPDGLTSIRRSYTVAEMRDRVPAGWSVRGRVPCRLELRWERRDA